MRSEESMFAKLRRALRAPRRVIRLAVRVVAAEAEIVLAELLELAPGGRRGGGARGALVEYAVYGAPGELPALPDLRGGGGRRAGRGLQPARWPMTGRSAGSEFHKPVLIGSPRPGGGSASLHVRPPWEARAGGAADAVGDRDRSWPGVWNRRAREHATVPGAAARAGRRASPAEGRCWTWARARGCSRSPRRSSATGRCSALDHDRESVQRLARTRASTASRSTCGASICARTAAADARGERSRACRSSSRQSAAAAAARPGRPLPSAPQHLIGERAAARRGRRDRRRVRRARTACTSASGARAASGPPCGCRAARERSSGAVGQLGRGAHDRAIDEVDRRRARRPGSAAGARGAQRRCRSSRAPRRPSPGSGSRQAASAMSSIASACSGTPANSAGPDEAARSRRRAPGGPTARSTGPRRGGEAAGSPRPSSRPAIVAAEHAARGGLVQAAPARATRSAR